MTALNRLALIVLLPVTLAACNDPPPATATATPTESELKHCAESLPPFWTKLRAAVARKDMDAVATMTSSGLLILRSDYQGKYLAIQDVASNFPQFLNAVPKDSYPGVEPKPASMRKLVEALPALAKPTCSIYGPVVNVGSWELLFTVPGGWRLEIIHVDAFPASMQHIQSTPIANPNDYDHEVRNCDESIHPFWKKFRAAVLAEDAEAVADMTHFPLDISTAKKERDEPLSRAQFIKRFPQMLADDLTYGHLDVQPQPVSMKELVRAMPTLAKEMCAPHGTVMPFDLWTFRLYKKTHWKLNYVAARKIIE